MDLKCIFIFVFFVACVTVASCKPQPLEDLSSNLIPAGVEGKAGLKDWMFEQLIRKALEAFRRLMKKGDQKRHIPVLDPLYTAEENGQFGDSNGIFNFKMENKNITTTGLSDFTINRIDASMFKLQATIDLTFSSVRRKGSYDVQANLLRDIHILYGNGLFDEGIKNLNIILRMDFGLTLKKLYVKTVNVKFNLQEGLIHLDGLLNRSKLGETISQVLTDGTANFINKNRARIQPMVDSKAKDKVSKLIDGMTLAELIEYLQALIDA